MSTVGLTAGAAALARAAARARRCAAARALVCAAALALVCAVCAVGAPAAMAAAPTVAPAHPAATIRVGGPAAVPATSTRQGFLGLATSLSTIPALAGPASDPDTPFVALLDSLSPGAPALLRLGGNSADDSWWPTPGVKNTHDLFTLTPDWGARVHALLTALGGRAILGVNLEVGPRIDSLLAPAEVADFNRYVGSNLIDAFELGNEPEYFPLSVVNGVRGERGHDTIAAYGTLFSHIASKLGGAPVAGPGSVGPVWLGELGTVLEHLPARLKLVTVHTYALKDCSRYAQLSMADFFTRASIQGLADAVHGEVVAAAAHGKAVRVDEFNGITCGGKPGMSNAFGEALWALNVLPALWRAGVQGVNVQSVYGDLNQVIHARHSAAGWSVSVEPEFYGLLAFADAAPAGSRLLRITNPGLAHFYQFAVRAPDGSQRVVLTNVGAAARTVAVTVVAADATDAGHGRGSVSRLSAPSLSATGQTTLGGRRLSPLTGRLTGTPRTAPVNRSAGGRYVVRVPAHSAAILTLPPPGRRADAAPAGPRVRPHAGPQ